MLLLGLWNFVSYWEKYLQNSSCCLVPCGWYPSPFHLLGVYISGVCFAQFSLQREFSLYSCYRVFLSSGFDKKYPTKAYISSVTCILKQANHTPLSGKPQFTNTKYSWTGIIEALSGSQVVGAERWCGWLSNLSIFVLTWCYSDVRSTTLLAEFNLVLFGLFCFE